MKRQLDQGIQELLTDLANNQLTSIDLSDFDLKSQELQELQELSYIIETLKTNNSLTSLSLARNKIGLKGAALLAQFLKENKTLTMLDISGCEIGDKGLKLIAGSLKINATLTKIDVSSNGITDDGIESLRGALKSNNIITSIVLVDNEIEEKTGHISAFLEKNTTLTELDLRSNIISDQGATNIANALISNNSLTLLDLSSNSISDQGAQMMAKVIKSNTSLQNFDLSSNPYLAEEELGSWSSKTETEIARALAENKNLIRFDAAFYFKDPEAIKIIIKLLITKDCKIEYSNLMANFGDTSQDTSELLKVAIELRKNLLIYNESKEPHPRLGQFEDEAKWIDDLIKLIRFIDPENADEVINSFKTNQIENVMSYFNKYLQPSPTLESPRLENSGLSLS